MTSKATKSNGAQAPNGAASLPDFAAMTLGGERGIEAVAEAQEHVIQRMARLNREVANFVQRRLEHDRETVASLAACRSPAEAMGVWSAFFSTASQQYSEAFASVAGITAAQARDAAEDLSHEMAVVAEPFTQGERHA
ncbi:MAG: phasin family protein [Pseudomonadota bacterium]